MEQANPTHTKYAITPLKDETLVISLHVNQGIMGTLSFRFTTNKKVAGGTQAPSVCVSLAR